MTQARTVQNYSGPFALNTSSSLKPFVEIFRLKKSQIDKRPFNINSLETLSKITLHLDQFPQDAGREMN